MRYIAKVQESFTEFNKQYFEKKPDALYQPINYAMQSGGKYVRPLLMIYAAELFHLEIDSVLKNAYGIELFHNFTLVHDDIMDNSLVRRGKPTVFSKFGLNSGVLSGDLMLIVAMQLASLKNDKTNPELFDLVSNTAIKIHEGQQMDVDFEEMTTVEEKEYIKMIEYKTAVLLACSLQMGAILAGANYADQSHLYEFGRLIGIAFQIQDDYLDAFGDAKVGKKIGGDILNNKKTLLFIASMNLGTEEQKLALLKHFSTKQAKESKKIEEVKEIFIKSGAQQYCKNLMKSLHQDAISCLKSLSTKKSLDSLLEIADLIIERKS
ncbi:MAG: polyprenyl synthetase family protein [Chitinophagales bacterium]